jgi:hypothetical protein
MTAPAAETLYLHIGARKSGTTYLQETLEHSRAALADNGLNLALTTGAAFAEFAPPLKTLGGPNGSDPATVAASLAMLAERLDRPMSRHLVSVEGLAEMRQVGVDALAGALSSYRVEVILTVRPWDRVIPSEWQQHVKERATIRYDDFLARIRQGGAPLFRMRQEAPSIVRHWLPHVPADRIHVVAVPPADTEGPSIEELFCRVVGIDPSVLVRPERTVNESLSYPQAELLRRVNAALGDRLSSRRDYRRAVRAWLVNQVLMKMPRDGHPIRVPAEHAEWCAGEMRRQRTELEAIGVDIVGDPDDLTPPVRTGETRVSADEIADAATELIVGLTTLRWTERGATRVAATGRGEGHDDS